MISRPRRSALYMPASNAKALAKARSLGADLIILDLEDAVAQGQKSDARRAAADFVKAGDFGHREILIRINALGTEWGFDDLQAAAEAQPHGILLPKIDRPQQITEIADRLAWLGTPRHVKLWAMIETPRAVLEPLNIADARREGEGCRLEGFVLGTNDLAKETSAELKPGRLAMLAWLSNTVAAARASGLAVLDGVYNNFSDLEGFALECQQGRELGFDGKTLIHPKQIEPCHQAFSPQAEAVAEAHGIVEAFQRPENKALSAISHSGKMVERLHLGMAESLIALHEAIRER